MSETELKKYLLQLKFDKALLTEASLSGASDYILLLGTVALQISTVEKIISNKTTNIHED